MRGSITSRDLLIAEKHGDSFSKVMKEYSMSQEQLEETIRKLFPKRRASNLIKTFRKNDKHQEVEMSKKRQQEPKGEIYREEVDTVEETVPDNVDEIVAEIEESIMEQPKSKLEILQAKELSLSESLSEAERELEKLYGIRAEVAQKVQSLTDEVHELKATIEQKVAEVGELRDYSAEINNQIASSELDVNALKVALTETQEAINVAQVITITVLWTGWFKFEPEIIDIPKVEVSAKELSTTSAQFALDSQFENLTIKNIKQLILLDKMVQELNNKYQNINVQFNDDNLELAWISWKEKES